MFRTLLPNQGNVLKNSVSSHFWLLKLTLVSRTFCFFTVANFEKQINRLFLGSILLYNWQIVLKNCLKVWLPQESVECLESNDCSNSHAIDLEFENKKVEDYSWWCSCQLLMHDFHGTGHLRDLVLRASRDEFSCLQLADQLNTVKAINSNSCVFNSNTFKFQTDRMNVIMSVNT